MSLEDDKFESCDKQILPGLGPDFCSESRILLIAQDLQAIVPRRSPNKGEDMSGIWEFMTCYLCLCWVNFASEDERMTCGCSRVNKLMWNLHLFCVMHIVNCHLILLAIPWLSLFYRRGN